MRTKAGQYYVNKKILLLVVIKVINGEWIDYTILKCAETLFAILYTHSIGKTKRLHYKKFFKKYRRISDLERVVKFGVENEG